ncbi:MAG TPA: V-type ATPase subunit [Bacillota bacterium]|nr:V-type ATPase subunit [Bacillota bacterium]
MKQGIKDVDYLAISARIRAMETHLLTNERLEKLLASDSQSEADKILAECGYPPLDPKYPEEMDAAIARERARTLEDIFQGAPDTRYVDTFTLKHDYHNVKTLLKAAEKGLDPEPLLVRGGRFTPEELKEAIDKNDYSALTHTIAQAIPETREALQRTKDPQLADAMLDRFAYLDMLDEAESTGSEFLIGYVKLQIDAVNLRTVVRTLRMGKPPEFIKTVLMEGGTVSPEELINVASNKGSGLAELYSPTLLAVAAGEGVNALSGGPLTDFERLCDDGVMSYLSSAQMIAFGEEVLLAYLSARETEYMNLRIILLGKAAGLDTDIIRSRIRESYV